MFMVRIDFVNQVFFLFALLPTSGPKALCLQKSSSYKKYLFLKTLQQSCFPTVKITKCKYKGCLFHDGSTKNKSGCFYKVWPSHWLEMNKNFKTTIKRQTLNHFKYFSLFFFFISVSLYSFFFSNSVST